ncbi:CGNR zinc finger domain-containing protein [Kitasatospora terrestris]|uniref:CGNR zinc finger domain-containing protein n=1 Tax=Kitasatospora terrestris TaxID=258051 RepID=A0ABP9EHR0_9ACTN
MTERVLALELASTVRHDGHGGVADDLTTPAELDGWVRDRADALDAGGFTADEAALAEVRALREAVRALFARAVSPAPPSPADAHRLLPLDRALERINTAAARRPVAPRLEWAEQAPPALVQLGAAADPLTRVTAALARATAEFLAGPGREQLRACTAPRCVRYFLKGHGRQEYCKPSCSNRARVARHYRRQKAVSADWETGDIATELPRS